MSLADEYALNVKERVKVGMIVTFTDGGVERVHDIAEGDVGVVLSIDSAGSLADFNVKVYIDSYFFARLPFCHSLLSFYPVGRLEN